MTDETVFPDQEILCSHQLLVRFDQMADGTVEWCVIPDEVIAQTRTIGSVCMAAAGAPAAALGIRALWQLCEDGLIYHALEAAFGVQIGVSRLMAARAVASAASPAAGGDGYVAPWIDSASCTSCDECIEINPGIFAYDDKKHAYVKDPRGGPYKDLVRAAEKCTAQVIHPGLPADRSEKDIDKLIKRAERFN